MRRIVCHNSIPSRSGAQENAAILPLVALLLGVFFMFAALAIDLTAAATRAQTSRQHIKLAALAALEEYYDTSGSDSEKLAAALARANQVAGLNLTLSFGNAASRTAANIVTNSDASGVVLEPGRWYYEQPSTGSVSGCSVYPCFKPETHEPNAFRITGQIHEGYTPIFMKAFLKSGQTLTTTTSATASVVPRHGAFLIDLSPSITRQTHLRTGQGKQFAYLLEADNPGIGRVPSHDNDWDPLISGNLINAYPTRGESPTVVTEHYADDYQLTATLSDENFILGSDIYGNSVDYSEHHPNPLNNSLYSVNTSLNYRVDKFRDGVYDGPQPLKTIFDALKTTISKFRERQVAGDKISLIFYDERLMWPRIISLTSDFDYVEKFTDWDQLGDAESGFERALQHSLFPGRATHTNIQLALAEALTQFSDAQTTSAPSSDFIVLIGDGLTNCVNCPPAPDYNGDGEVNNLDKYHVYFCFDTGVSYDYCTAYCLSNYSYYQDLCGTYLGSVPSQCPPPQSVCDKDDANGDGQINWDDFYQISEEIDDYLQEGCIFGSTCSNLPEHYYYSMKQLKEYVAEWIYPTQIPVHVVQIGDKVAPHTLEVPSDSDPSVCITETQARSQEEPLVKGLGDHFECKANSCWAEDGGTILSDDDIREAWYTTFYQANADMYDIARMTGGIWAPIRPLYPGCVPGSTPACNTGTDLDSSGRRVYDPQCRSVYQQMVDYIEEILGQNPYTIVDHY